MSALSFIKSVLRSVIKFAYPYLLTEVLLKRNLSIFSKYVKGRAVDFGCGDFRLSGVFQSQVTELFGIDNWLAANYHRLAPANVLFYYASIEKAPFQESSFDSVICTEVLEHVNSPETVLKECFRILKVEGHLLISIPFNFFVHGAPNDFRRYTIYGLERLLSHEGFELVEYSLVGNTFYTILNDVITYFGYRKSNRIGWILNRAFVSCLNMFGLAALKLSSKPRVYQKTSPIINDRTNPIGYVLVAISKKQGKDAPVRESDRVVCHHCHSRLNFLRDKIVCTNCNKVFRYYEGVPVLADKEMLHLEYEARCERVDF